MSARLVKAQPVVIAVDQPAAESVNQKKADECHDRRQQNRAYHVAERVVSHLMAHHDEQLGFI